MEFSYKVQTWRDLLLRHYAIGANEVVDTPVFPFLIFSTSCALNSSKFSGFATDN